MSENVVKRLKKAGLSRPQIARAVGVTRQAVGKWEHGKGAPNGKNLVRLVALAQSRGVVLLASDLYTGQQGS